MGREIAIARLFAEQLQTRFGKVAIVENRAGAGGRIGVQAVKNAAPGEETMLFASASQFTLQPHLFMNLGYDAERDFVPISQVMTVDLALAVSGQLPIHSAHELIDWMKANPAQAVYGSPGAGTAPHFICGEFGRITGLNLRHTPYKGTPAAIPDVLAGRVPMYMAFVSELLEQHKGGGIRIIATAAATRSSFLPQTATLTESGIDIDASGWFAFYAPAHSSRQFVERLRKGDLCDRERSRNARKDSRHGLRADRNYIRRTQTNPARRLPALGADREDVRIHDREVTPSDRSRPKKNLAKIGFVSQRRSNYDR